MILFTIYAIGFGISFHYLWEATKYLFETINAGWADETVRTFGKVFLLFVILALVFTVSTFYGMVSSL